MQPKIALLLCVIFIAWLFIRERRLQPMRSWLLWVALLWIWLVGSRPVTGWFGGGISISNPDDYLQGSPLDRNVFLLLIVVGVVGLFMRRVDWPALFRANRWLFAFFLFFGISMLWSDYPFVSFKRWIKDVGNIIMLLIILTETDPVQALKAVFNRFIYLAIPLSGLFIKYYPDIGRYYNIWTWEPVYCGVTTGKNALGSIAFISGLFLIWQLLLSRDRPGKRDNLFLISYGLLMVMIFWLFRMAGSSTSFVSLLIGVAVLLYLRSDMAKRQIRHLGTYSIIVIALLFALFSIPGAAEFLLGLIHRDLTFTGRTDLWADLMLSKINPIIGTGYQSFWFSETGRFLWFKYPFHPTQAHNAYIETYLNGGIVGLSLLIIMILSSFRRLKQRLMANDSSAVLCFAFLLTTVIYSWTEAMINRQSLVWIVMLLGLLHYNSKTAQNS